MTLPEVEWPRMTWGQRSLVTGVAAFIIGLYAMAYWFDHNSPQADYHRFIELERRVTELENKP